MASRRARFVCCDQVPRNPCEERAEEEVMAKASKETTPTTMDFEIAEDRSCQLEDSPSTS